MLEDKPNVTILKLLITITGKGHTVQFFIHVILLIGMYQGTAAALETAEEYEIKAAYLFNLGNFVKWPEPFLPNNLEICLLGEDPFGSNLELVAKKERKIQNKPVLVRRLNSLMELGECAILFISSSEQANLTTLLNKLKGKPILTVGDSEQFVALGGMVQFYQREGKIRLMVDPQTFEEHNLKPSSQLMRIAQRPPK